jgi:predicted ATPase
LLSIPTGERYSPLNLTPQKQKEKTLQALVAQVQGLAARQPVLMMFEDAQWSDPTSLELLDLIIDRVPGLRALLIITFRPEFAPPWTGRPHISLLSLSRLAPRQRAQMIAGITGGKALPPDIAAQIIDRTDGVPLFVEELTKALVESGMLSEAGDRYTAAGPVTSLAIPATLQASLLARLDRLAPVREVAQIGAALGRRFSHELISAVAQMPPAQLDDALTQLVGAELIYRGGTPPNAEYTFKHGLVQDAAYSTLLRSRRQQLHARVGTTLEDRFPEIVAAQPALLAHHCTEAGLTEQAIAYWLAAGRQAWGRSMLAEAVAVLQRGLALVPALPDGDPSRERELDLQMALGQALTANRGWGGPELDHVHSRARELACALNRPRALLFAIRGQFWDHWARADLKQARRLAADLRELGSAAGDILMQVNGWNTGGVVCFQLGDFVRGRAYLEKALALYQPAHRPSDAEKPPYDIQVQLRTHSSWLLACLGYLDQALLQSNAAVDEARRLSRPLTLAFAMTSAWQRSWFGSLQPKFLLRQAEELLALTAEHDLGLYRALGLIVRGWCLAALGCADEGISLVGAGLAGMDELGFMAHRAWFLAFLGDACRMAGQWHTALEHLAEARRLAEETGERWCLAETVRMGGDTLLAMGDPKAAEASYHDALDLARRQGARLWELRAATSLARLWRDRGKRAEARDLVAPVYGWFTEGFGTPVLQEAKALLDELA